MHIIVKAPKVASHNVISSEKPVIHKDYTSAETEAKRLAQLNPDFVFYVMYACVNIQIPTPQPLVTKLFNNESPAYR